MNSLFSLRSFTFFLLLSLVSIQPYSLYGENFKAPTTTIEIPMRDGLPLKADVYAPSGGHSKDKPCLLVRAPSGRDSEQARRMAALADWDYTVVVQDTRSVTDPKGSPLPYLDDAWGSHPDGFDTVEWLASSEWSNGKVASVGESALGITQLLMAPTAPPSLKCQVIQAAAPSMYQYAIFKDGRLRKEQVECWLSWYADNPAVMNFVKNQNTYEGFWEQLDAVAHAETAKAPAIHIGGWYDIFVEGTIDAFTAFQERGGEGAKGQQKLVIGPWHHWWPLTNELGDFTVPEAARTLPDHLSSKAWLDFHLKGEKNGIDRAAAVNYFVMGPMDGDRRPGNVWRTSNVWPVASKPKALVLTHGGALADGVTESTKTKLAFQHDPKNPVPTLGGKNLFIPSGPKDQSSVEARDDVVVFTSDILDQDMEVTGSIVADLFIDTDVDDADVVIRLCDVYPDGRSILITEGFSRFNRTPGDTPEAVQMTLAPTSMVFAKGHRIRVSVSGSNYPCFDVAPGAVAAEGDSVANHNIWIGPDHVNRVVLPVVEG